MVVVVHWFSDVTVIALVFPTLGPFLQFFVVKTVNRSFVVGDASDELLEVGLDPELVFVKKVVRQG